MIEVSLRFRCIGCGVAVDFATPVPQFPMKLGIGVGPENVPAGWTVDQEGAHCPQHKPSRIVPARVQPAADEMKRMLNGRS